MGLPRRAQDHPPQRDAASLEALRKSEEEAVATRLAKQGLGALVESVEGERAGLLVFPTYWAQAAKWTDGQRVELRVGEGKGVAAKVTARENLSATARGRPSCGELADPANADHVKAWAGGKVVRVVGR